MIISLLPAGTTPAGTEAIPAVQGGQTVQLTAAQICPIVAGPAAPVSGISQAVDWLLGTAAAKLKLIAGAGLWAGKVYSGLGIARIFNSSNNSAVAATAPNAALYVYAENAGTNNDVVAILGDANVSVAGKTGFGANFIARNEAGVNGAKLVGCEVDVEFAAATTAGAGSAGLYINIFSAASAGPAIQTGAHVGGTWTNGLVLAGLEATISAGVAPSAGDVMGALINSGVCTYGLDAIVLSNTHKLRFSGTASAHGKIYMDGSNFLHIVGGTAGIALRDSTDSTSAATIADDGTITLGSGVPLKTQGPVNAYAFTAIPAGGTAGSGYMLSSTANFGVFFGSGAPSLSAAKGSLYLRSDGSGTTDRAYINTNGSTTWTALTTVA